MLRHTFVTVCLNAGISVGKQSNIHDVKDVVSKLKPVQTEHELIRLGAAADGGYLVPDDLDGIAACFSPGVSTHATFEEELIGRGIPCFLADASVDGAPIPDVDFRKKFLGVVLDDRTITLDDWVDDVGLPGDLILQMDIEGSEWPVLLNVRDETLHRFRMLIVEFHDLDRLMDKFGLPILRSVFLRLMKSFEIVHVHPNNYGGVVRKGTFQIPRSLEITFLRKDRARTVTPARALAHPLDRPNTTALRDISLPAAWFDDAVVH